MTDYDVAEASGLLIGDSAPPQDLLGSRLLRFLQQYDYNDLDDQLGLTDPDRLRLLTRAVNIFMHVASQPSSPQEVMGDILAMVDADHFDCIIHGCNCCKQMTGGLARQIAKKIPSAAKADAERTPKGCTNALGDYSVCNYYTPSGHLTRIYNLYSQFFGGPDLRIPSLLTAATKVAALERGRRIGIPHIGCGIGGGDWSKLKPELAAIFTESDITFVMFGRGDDSDRI